jgi:hypothetical protein
MPAVNAPGSSSGVQAPTLMCSKRQVPLDLKEDFEAHVRVNPFAFLISFDFGEPDITACNAFKDCFFDYGVCHVPHNRRQVNTSFSPRDFIPRHINKVQNVWMIEVKMENYCSVLVYASASELFVKTTIDFSK